MNATRFRSKTRAHEWTCETNPRSLMTGSDRIAQQETMSNDDPSTRSEITDELLGGRYKLLECIGKGGMGVVYRGEHAVIGRPVAIKLLQAHFASNEHVTERFVREAQAAANIDHPNICAATDFGRTSSGELFLVMEMLEGQNLKDLIAREGALSVERAVSIAAQTVSALGRAHANGIIHRDLKPENIFLIERHGVPDFVKVLDFGLVRFADVDNNATITHAGDIVGTPKYMAPEQAAAETVDHRADLYSLGVMLYEMLTGVPPFDCESAIRMLVAHMTQPPPSFIEAKPDLEPHPALEQLVMDLLSKNPGDRIESAGAVLEVLQSVEVEPSQHATATLSPSSIAACEMPPTRMMPDELDYTATVALLIEAADRQDEAVATPKKFFRDESTERSALLETAPNPLAAIQDPTPTQPGSPIKAIPERSLKQEIIIASILLCVGLALVVLFDDEDPDDTPTAAGTAQGITPPAGFSAELEGLRAREDIAAALTLIGSSDRKKAAQGLTAMKDIVEKDGGEPGPLTLLLAEAHAKGGSDVDAISTLTPLLDKDLSHLADPSTRALMMTLFARKGNKHSAAAKKWVAGYLAEPLIIDSLFEVAVHAEHLNARLRALSLIEEEALFLKKPAWTIASTRLRSVPKNKCAQVKPALAKLIEVSADEGSLDTLSFIYEDLITGCGTNRASPCCPALTRTLKAHIGALEGH